MAVVVLVLVLVQAGEGTHPDALLQLGLAGSHHAQPSLFLQAAVAVVVGDPGGDAEAAALRAGAPLGGLDQAVLPHHGEIRAVGFLLPVGCRGEKKAELEKPKPPLMPLRFRSGALNRSSYRPRQSPRSCSCSCRENHTPTPRSTSLEPSPSWAWGSQGWAAARPWSRAARSPRRHPDRCTGTCSCSGTSLRSCRRCLRTRRWRRREL